MADLNGHDVFPIVTKHAIQKYGSSPVTASFDAQAEAAACASEMAARTGCTVKVQNA